MSLQGVTEFIVRNAAAARHFLFLLCRSHGGATKLCRLSSECRVAGMVVFWSREVETVSSNFCVVHVIAPCCVSRLVVSGMVWVASPRRSPGSLRVFALGAAGYGEHTKCFRERVHK